MNTSCFECGAPMKAIRAEYKTTVRGKEVVLPDVPMERCDSCGDCVIGIEGNVVIASRLLSATPLSQG